MRLELSSIAKSLTYEINTNKKFAAGFLTCIQELASSVQHRLATAEQALLKEKTRIDELLKECDTAESNARPSPHAPSEFNLPDFSQIRMDFDLFSGKNFFLISFHWRTPVSSYFSGSIPIHSYPIISILFLSLSASFPISLPSRCEFRMRKKGLRRRIIKED